MPSPRVSPASYSESTWSARQSFLGMDLCRRRGRCRSCGAWRVRRAGWSRSARRSHRSPRSPRRRCPRRATAAAVGAEEPFVGQPLHGFLGAGGAMSRDGQSAVVDVDVHRSGVDTGQVGGQDVVIVDLAQVHRHEPWGASRSGLAGQQAPGQGIKVTERIKTKHSNSPPMSPQSPPPWRAAKSLCSGDI